ncbi:MAG: sigma-70 family RNA polymerase sigma factor [Armatimonadetes bacterium]|nr:sigma-70 family RNA polymerase sigma factor [Armatimonadota bacterium]
MAKTSAATPKVLERGSPLAILCESCVNALYSVAVRLTRRRDTAEDLVQDTYVRALRARARYDEELGAKGWLFAIMRRLHLDDVRRLRRSPQVDSLDDREDFVLYEHLSRDAAASSAEEAFLAHYLDGCLAATVEALPEDLKLPLLLSAGGFTYREMARILGWPVGTVMSRLHRARRLVQRLLVQQCRETGQREDGP